MNDTNSISDKKAKPSGKNAQRLRLPFEQHHKDTGTWVYEHREGVFVTLIVYLVLAIAFVSAKIVIHSANPYETINVDLKTLEQLQKQKEQLEKEVRKKMPNQEADYSNIANRISNENAKSDKQNNFRNADMAEIEASAARAQARMSANRARYEQGLGEEQAIRDSRPKSSDKTTSSDTRAKGRVTVSFSFDNPVRFSQHLEIPAYRCERGGEVVVDATLNRNGNVIAATVNKSLSSGDDCMYETALGAARRSRFNIDGSAPEKQTGTITYIFIPQ